MRAAVVGTGIAGLASALLGGATVEDALRTYARARRDHARFYQWSSRILTPFFQSDGRLLGALRDAFKGPVGRLPILRREFLATLTGHKAGIAVRRLEP
jgi:2-polyprenyl-6-methoxyphenol hydroxylase-like FAD-dependent oxidoreductase